MSELSVEIAGVKAVANPLSPALLAVRTIKHLRWEQLTYRPWRMAQYKLYRRFPQLTARWHAPATSVPEISASTLTSLRTICADSFTHLNAPLEQYEQRLLDLQHHRFTLLNRTLELTPLDWNRRYENHLWNYQLHYFCYAVWGARAFVERGDTTAMNVCQNLIESWVREARIGRSDGWDAYPISLRVVNWIYAYALVAETYPDQSFLGLWRTSIYQQLDFLSRHLEFHLLANHLLKNAKALVIGGLFFGHEAWLRKGERLLWRELNEQVLRDGGHYERAPMYHAIALTDWLECFALLKAAGRRINNEEEIATRLRTMAGFLEAMSYADGTLALFNDSANSEEARPQPILAAAERIVGYRARQYASAFPQTGYYLWSSAEGQEKIIIDAGEPAVSYNTAHAQCDLLSYELWLEGRPFIVDSGVHGYGGDQFREYCRATRAHNTVMFDKREQSEVWGTFRLARRAEVVRAAAQGDEAKWMFAGAYHPYYNKQWTHEREIRRAADGAWIIADVLHSSDAGPRAAWSFIHLHPAFTAQRQAGSATIECRAGNLVILIEPFSDSPLQSFALARGNNYGFAAEQSDPTVQRGWYFPDFGIAQSNVMIQLYYAVAPGEAFGYRISVQQS
jgi:uncharacterized heparinase superfamily protein